MTDNHNPSGRKGIVSRRSILKATGTSIVTAGFAGCSGGGDSGSGGSSGGSGGSSGDSGGSSDGSGGSGGTTTSGGSSDDLSDVEFQYWNTVNVQSRKAKAVSQALLSSFQKDTGASVKTNWTGYGGVIGAKWKTSFGQGNYPVLYDSTSAWDGQFEKWIKPFSEYQGQFSDDFLEGIEWLTPKLKEQWGGFGNDVVYEVPLGFSVQVPFVARMDHFDEAGLSRDRFPPKSYDDLIDIATTLQKDGPGEYGYQMHGTKFDAFDCRAPDLVADVGGEKGTFLNEDWSDTYWDNDAYKTGVRRWVEMYTKHNLSGPGTPNHDDEAMVQEIVSGRCSMTGGDFLNHPNFLDSAPDMMENGDIQWGAMWKGGASDASAAGFIRPLTFGITKPPEGADQAAWEKKQKAAIELIKYFTSKGNQKALFENFGLMPARDDVWDELPTGQPHNVYNAATTMAENTDMVWEAHPATVSMQYNVPGPELQKALKGEISPEQACDNVASTIRNEFL
ncbi:MAG: extracellular solute-binding protein [Halobacteriaceae archaeon]